MEDTIERLRAPRVAPRFSFPSLDDDPIPTNGRAQFPATDCEGTGIDRRILEQIVAAARSRADAEERAKTERNRVVYRLD